MAMSLRRAGVTPGERVLFIGSQAKASGLRLFLRGQGCVVRADTLAAASQKNFHVLIVPQREAAALRARGAVLQLAAQVVRAPEPQTLWSAFRRRAVADALDDASEKYFLARLP
jgi:hypothetical protein